MVADSLRDLNFNYILNATQSCKLLENYLNRNKVDIPIVQLPAPIDQQAIDMVSGQIVPYVLNAISPVASTKKFTKKSNYNKPVAISHDQKKVIFCKFRQIFVYDTKTTNCIFTKKFEANINSICFSPDDKRIAIAADDQIIIIDLYGNTLNIKNPLDVSINYIAFSPDQKMIAACSRVHNSGIVWNLEDNTVRHCIGHLNPIRQITFSPNGQYIVTLTNNNIKVWDLQANNLVTINTGGTQLQFFPDGLTFAVIGYQKAKIFDLHGNCIKELFHSQSVPTICLSPNGKFLASLSGSSYNGTLSIWDLNTTTIVKKISLSKRPKTFYFSLDGTKIRFLFNFHIQTYDLTHLLTIKEFLENELTLNQALFLLAFKRAADNNWSFNYSSKSLQSIFQSLPQEIQTVIQKIESKKKWKFYRKCLITGSGIAITIGAGYLLYKRPQWISQLNNGFKQKLKSILSSRPPRWRRLFVDLLDTINELETENLLLKKHINQSFVSNTLKKATSWLWRDATKVCCKSFKENYWL